MGLHRLILCFTIFIAFVSHSVLSQETEGSTGGNIGSEFNIGARSTGSVGTGGASGSGEGYGGVSGNSNIGGNFGSKVGGNGGMNDTGSVGSGETNEISRNKFSNQEGYLESQGNKNNTLRANV